MAKDRNELQSELRKLAPKVWYKRPPDNKMTYPCILYRPSRPRVFRADNRVYRYVPGYNVIYISREPNDEIDQQMLSAFDYCMTDRIYESDGLYHYSYVIYF